MDDIKDAHFTESELEELTDLYNAMLTMEDSSEMHKFFVDLCSINELHSLLLRWQIVRRIEQGKSYEEIIKEISPAEVETNTQADSGKKSTGRARGKARSSTKVSSTTISLGRSSSRLPSSSKSFVTLRLEMVKVVHFCFCSIFTSDGT